MAAGETGAGSIRCPWG